MGDSRLMRELGGMVLDQLRDALTRGRGGANLAPDEPEPPVVAQLMIEIRSDGSRTIARGALNDLRHGESASVHAEGRTPQELMLSLANSLLALPTSLFERTRTATATVKPAPKTKQDALASDAPLPPKTGK